MKYLHVYNGQYIVSSKKYLDGCQSQDVSTLYDRRVPLHAPWLVENSKSFLRKILRRTPKTALDNDRIEVYVFANDPIIKEVQVPSSNIIPVSRKSICPPQLTKHKTTSKKQTTLSEAQARLRDQVRGI